MTAVLRNAATLDSVASPYFVALAAVATLAAVAPDATASPCFVALDTTALPRVAVAFLALAVTSVIAAAPMVLPA